jgi:hypothetical protein
MSGYSFENYCTPPLFAKPWIPNEHFRRGPGNEARTIAKLQRQRPVSVIEHGVRLQQK